METEKSLALAAAVMLCCAGVVSAEPMGTAWTYQGRLYDMNEPANGRYEMQFELYNAASDGNQLGWTVAFRSVEVNDGYFTVVPDFGSEVFDGNACWLEISVRPEGTADPFTTLSFRQELTPTPYALQTRGLFVNDALNVGIGNKDPQSRLDIKAANGNSTGGLRVTSSVSDNTVVHIQDASPGDRGMIAVRADGSNRVVFRADGDSYFAGGDVGIGTTNPTAPLHIRSTGGIDLTVEADSDNSGESDNARLVLSQDGGAVIGRIGFRAGLNKLEIMQEYGDAIILGTNNTDHMVINGAGQVGIGTSSIPTGISLAVDGGVLCEEVEVQLSQDWPDYVFEPDYEPMPLDQLGEYVRQEKHLPDIPAAETVADQGIPIGQMQTQMLRKVEELTLYVVDLNRQLTEVRSENESLRERIAVLEGISD